MIKKKSCLNNDFFGLVIFPNQELFCGFFAIPKATVTRFPFLGLFITHGLISYIGRGLLQSLDGLEKMRAERIYCTLACSFASIGRLIVLSLLLPQGNICDRIQEPDGYETIGNTNQCFGIDKKLPSVLFLLLAP